MTSVRQYPESFVMSGTSYKTSCSLIDAVYSAAFAGCAEISSLFSVTFHCASKMSSGRSSFDTTHGSFSTDCSSINKPYSSDNVFYNDHDFDSAYHQFSRTSHMGILDPSYRLFTSRHGNGSLVYKVKTGIIVVAGDPLCEPSRVRPLLDEFQRSHGKGQLKFVYIGASKTFAEESRKKGCMTMHFGQERVLNPLTNPVLHHKAGKRILSQCRQLLDTNRGNISIGIYAPGVTGCNPSLEAELQEVYDSWRESRNQEPDSTQAFITQYQLFSCPDIAVFIYTCDHNGKANGIAGLRCLGATKGFQLDPCVAAHDAPRGITDLLVVLSMQLLRAAGVSFLSLGFEPFAAIKEMDGQRAFLAQLTRDGYRRVMRSVHVAGKRAYYEKFRPDDSKSSALFIILSPGTFHIREFYALMRTANISLRRIITN